MSDMDSFAGEKCAQCTSVPVITTCVDCDDLLCGDCIWFDEKSDEPVCETCKNDREMRDPNSVTQIVC